MVICTSTNKKRKHPALKSENKERLITRREYQFLNLKKN